MKAMVVTAVAMIVRMYLVESVVIASINDDRHHSIHQIMVFMRFLHSMPCGVDGSVVEIGVLVFVLLFWWWWRGVHLLM
jgi:hypothetical protein